MPIVKTDVYDVQAPFALDLRLVKADMNARNAIGTFQRYVGMTVFVLSDNTFWQLQGGTTNDDWVEVDGSSGIVMQSVVVNSGAPTGGNDGDIWFRQVGSTVTVYQRVSGTWTALGVIETGPEASVIDVPPGSGTTYTLEWDADLRNKHGTFPNNVFVFVKPPNYPPDRWRYMFQNPDAVLDGDDGLVSLTVTISNLQAKIIIK